MNEVIEVAANLPRRLPERRDVPPLECRYFLGQQRLLNGAGDAQFGLDALAFDRGQLLLAYKLGDTHGRRGLYGQVVQQPAIVAGILLVAAALADVDDAYQFSLTDQGDDHDHAFVL